MTSYIVKNNYYKKNINLINKSNFLIEQKFCYFPYKKNGKLIFLDLYKDTTDYLCLINNIDLFILRSPFQIIGIDENNIIKKLLLLHHIQKYSQDIKYIINSDNGSVYTLFKNKNTKKIIDRHVFKYIYFNDKNKINKYFYNNKLKILSTHFMFIYNKKKNKNMQKILIEIFYTSYVKLIKDELLKKYNKNFNDFANYEELYIFLKQIGYVNKFYNNYAPKIINNYTKFNNHFEKLVNNKKYDNYRNQEINKIKNFNDFDLLELIDNYKNNMFDISYIKKKFIELTEKKI